LKDLEKESNFYLSSPIKNKNVNCYKNLNKNFFFNLNQVKSNFLLNSIIICKDNNFIFKNKKLYFNTLHTNYLFDRNFFKKSNQPNQNQNSWQFGLNNGFIKIFSKNVRPLFNLNLLKRTKEAVIESKTNGVSLTKLDWDASDRYFLRVLRKNKLTNNNLLDNLERGFIKNKQRNEVTFFKNSDHSDLNRWLKRG
tara:strand:- start:100 stop:684 length:585 start_codon:yes stop_codon:yes gene_type:complete